MKTTALTICACAILAACASPKISQPECKMPENLNATLQMHDGQMRLVRAAPLKVEFTCSVVQVEKDPTAVNSYTLLSTSYEVGDQRTQLRSTK